MSVFAPEQVEKRNNFAFEDVGAKKKKFRIHRIFVVHANRDISLLRHGYLVTYQRHLNPVTSIPKLISHV